MPSFNFKLCMDFNILFHFKYPVNVYTFLCLKIECFLILRFYLKYPNLTFKSVYYLKTYCAYFKISCFNF